ncbi:MAG: helicase-exonuclease AddAB subunit AddB [Butyrivibrio sp.]|nr:helicase-exonuclease AddAB subunit AddB [Butyrivibrio sp.]
MLKFYFGASGAGKSTKVYEEIIEKSIREPETNFLIIVPDQFTMQTQMDIVKMHPRNGIMNIDVLSFGRLSYRIFEETGGQNLQVLDDIGKSLVLRRVADMLGDSLPVIGSNMHKAGYIDEVKSTISEFMQYGIEYDQIMKLESISKGHGALKAKLHDLGLLYKSFKEYIQDRFITTEETLDILCSKLEESEIVKQSVIVFDGFTGFTPIQYRVIKKLLKLSKELIVTVTTDTCKDYYALPLQEQELFLLSQKTTADLERLEYEVQAENGTGSMPSFDAFRQIRHSEGIDVALKDVPVKRLENNPEMSFLERHLFRYTGDVFEGQNSAISIYRASNPMEEVRQTLIKIRELVREEKCHYRDIAIVCGNLETYGPVFAKEEEVFDVPLYIDRTTNIGLNPFIEYIRSAINVVITNYSYEAVFHYMRSGMTDFDAEDIDLFENYIRALGIRGRKRWEDIFTRHMKVKRGKASEEEETAFMELMNTMRSKVVSGLSPLFEAKKGTVKDISTAIYNFVSANESATKLNAMADKFKEDNDLIRSKEYSQIYGRVMYLLEQMVSLMGEDTIKLDEYLEILEAGFGEIEVGTIPQSVDRIVVGDIERTRLKEIKYLFFTGVNDGSIPKGVGSGGILSDIDRQFLMDSETEGIELAPTPRQQMYIQRLYLYMNLTKPSRKLYLSYSNISTDGKSIRPAYLIGKIMSLFPALTVSEPELDPVAMQLETYADSMDYIAGQIREYADGRLDTQQAREFFTLYYRLQLSQGEKSLQKLQEAAFKHYKNTPLSQMIAGGLYGAFLENSVSRLEQYASCAYAHFLKYGLALDERDEFSFEASDLGNVFHGVLENFSKKLVSKGLDWRTFSSEQADELLSESLTAYVENYGENILLSSKRNEYMIERIRRILTRTVNTLQYQLQKGVFNPSKFEVDFKDAGNIDEINITLTIDEERRIKERMRLHGRIDRMDLYEDEDNVYVKIIDFKSGKKDFDICSLYYGLQLQLVMYMNVGMAMEENEHPGKKVIPSAILYYRVNDPIVKAQQELSADEINEQIKKELRMTGLVNSSDEVISLLDTSLSGKSDVIPVERTKSGSFSANSSVISSEDYKIVSGYVNQKIRSFGKKILQGDIEVNPYLLKQRDACTYCSYKGICGYDPTIPGYNKRELESLKEDEVMTRIKADNQEE